MIFAYKKFGLTETRVDQDMSTHRGNLKFAEWLHRGSASKFFDLLTNPDVDEICRDEPEKKSGGTVSVLADVLASVLTEMYGRKYVDKRWILNGLRFCRDLVSSLGYRETNEGRFLDHCDGKPNVVLVAGCQNRRMMRNRVAAARRLCRILPAPISIVFSGVHPPRNRAPIPDESMRMENLFFEGLRGVPNFMSKITRNSIEIEAKSKRTGENIKEFFALKLLEKQDSSNVALVSSTFHLARLAQYFEADVGERVKHVNTLLLVGSERLDRLEKVAADKQYAKQVFFQLALFMFTELKKDGLRLR